MMWWRTIQRATACALHKSRQLMTIFKRRPVVNLLAVGVTYIVYDFSSWHASLLWQRRSVVRSIRQGSCTETPQSSYVCDRKDIIDRLYKLLHPSSDVSLYKVIVGPLGCGKTWCMTTAINKNTTGIIYVDARSVYSFPKALAQAAGINLLSKPTLIEVLRRHSSALHREPIYFSLPDTKIPDQINYVLDIIQQASVYYHKVYRKKPTLVIDSADVIAKADRESFELLIRLCKSFVNDKILNIILVSLEGHVIPTMQAMSEGSRQGMIIHIPDICSEDAIKFLTEQKCEQSFAKKIAAVSGGRLLYLIQALDVKHMIEDDSKVDQTYITDRVMKHLTSLVANDFKRSNTHIGQDMCDMKAAALDALVKKSMDEEELQSYLLDRYKWKDQKKLAVALDELLKGNVVVLREEGMLEFQTPLHQKYWEGFKNRFKVKI